MPILQVALILVVVGVLLYVANHYIPMDAKIKQILNGVVVLAVVLWLLSLFGMFSWLDGIRVGKP
jgi:hydrogenase-4 membrane subunit HyfE